MENLIFVLAPHAPGIESGEGMFPDAVMQQVVCWGAVIFAVVVIIAFLWAGRGNGAQSRKVRRQASSAEPAGPIVGSGGGPGSVDVSAEYVSEGTPMTVTQAANRRELESAAHAYRLTYGSESTPEVKILPRADPHTLPAGEPSIRVMLEPRSDKISVKRL